MAGLLSAQPNVTKYFTGATADGIPVAVVSLLGPVEAANNVLLYAVIMFTDGADPDVATLQWHRAGVNNDGELEALGAAVGDPMVVDVPGNELIQPAVLCIAVDTANTVTSAYALMLTSADETVTAIATAIADALTFD